MTFLYFFLSLVFIKCLFREVGQGVQILAGLSRVRRLLLFVSEIYWSFGFFNRILVLAKDVLRKLLLIQALKLVSTSMDVFAVFTALAMCVVPLPHWGSKHVAI